MDFNKRLGDALGSALSVTLTKGQNCPNCGYNLNAHSSIMNPDTPQEGDISVCAKCGNIMIYNADLTLRKPSPEEERELVDNSEALQAVKAKFQKRIQG